MNMKMDVSIRAKRILKPMGRFRLLNEPLDEENIGALKDGEVLIGVYENDDGGNIFVTNRGLLIRSKKLDKHILFSDISNVRSPSDKQGDYTILLVLANGVEVPLEVRGTRGRFSDVFEFTRFLDRVMSDLDS